MNTLDDLLRAALAEMGRQRYAQAADLLAPFAHLPSNELLRYYGESLRRSGRPQEAIEALMQEQQVYAYQFEGTRYDAGTTMGWLRASVELALARPELGDSFRAYLKELEL